MSLATSGCVFFSECQNVLIKQHPVFYIFYSSKGVSWDRLLKASYNLKMRLERKNKKDMMNQTWGLFCSKYQCWKCWNCEKKGKSI